MRFASVLEMQLASVVDELKDLGLTTYEAKCYVSLARLGPSNVRTLASEAEVPYPSAYEALRTLSSKGWVELVKRRPAMYRARRPSAVREMVRTRLEETFESLDKVYSADPVEDAELVYTARGAEKVLSKIQELLAGARTRVMMVAPTMSLTDGKVLELLDRVRRRGVEVRFVGDDEALGLLPSGVELRTGNLVAVDLLVDDRVALISLPDFSACGWIESPQVAQHFKQFLELMWSTSSPA